MPAYLENFFVNQCCPCRFYSTSEFEYCTTIFKCTI